MDNENKNIRNKVPLNKIIVPLIIVVIIAGIWLVKGLAGTSTDKTDGMEDFIPENKDFALNVDGEMDFEALKSYGLPIVLDFGSETCPPCREMAPILKKVHKDLQGKAIIKYIDVQEYQDIAAEYPVRVVPTQLFFDGEGNPYIPEDPEASQMLIYTSKETGEHMLTAHEGGLGEKQLLEILKDMGMQE